MIHSTLPSLNKGYYSPQKRGAQALYPQLWNRCLLACAPFLGQGGRLYDHVSGFQSIAVGTDTQANRWPAGSKAGGSQTYNFSSTKQEYFPLPEYASPDKHKIITVALWMYHPTFTGTFESMWAISNGTSLSWVGFIAAGIIGQYVNGNGEYANETSNAIIANTWSQVIIEKDVIAGHARFWINNILDSTVVTSSVVPNASNRFYIGTRPDQAGQEASMFLAEIAMWGRALSQYERVLLTGGAITATSTTYQNINPMSGIGVMYQAADYIGYRKQSSKPTKTYVLVN